MRFNPWSLCLLVFFSRAALAQDWEASWTQYLASGAPPALLLGQAESLVRAAVSQKALVKLWDAAEAELAQPGDPAPSRLVLAKIHDQLQDPMSAVEDYRIATASLRDPAVERDLLESLKRAGLLEEALEVCKAGDETYGSDPAWAKEAMGLLLTLGRCDEASGLSKTLLEQWPQDQSVWRVSADAASQCGQYEEALRLYREMASRWPQACFQIMIARALRDLGRYPEALATYQSVDEVCAEGHFKALACKESSTLCAYLGVECEMLKKRTDRLEGLRIELLRLYREEARQLTAAGEGGPAAELLRKAKTSRSHGSVLAV